MEQDKKKPTLFILPIITKMWIQNVFDKCERFCQIAIRGLLN